jgi:hypothetical protein
VCQIARAAFDAVFAVRRRSGDAYRNTACIKLLRRRFLPPVNAFGEFFDDLGVKCRNVVGLAARDQSVIGDDFSIDPFRARVFQIFSERRPRRDGSAAHDAGFDQRPRRVTDRADRFAGVEKRFNKARPRVRSSAACRDSSRRPAAAARRNRRRRLRRRLGRRRRFRPSSCDSSP